MIKILKKVMPPARTKKILKQIKNKVIFNKALKRNKKVGIKYFIDVSFKVTEIIQNYKYIYIQIYFVTYFSWFFCYFFADN